MQAPRRAQDPSHPGFVDRGERYDCERCVAWHGDRFGFPELGVENLEAWEMYHRVQGQQRIGMDIIGIDWTAIGVAFETYRVPYEERPELLEKISVIDNALLAMRAEKRKAEENRRRAEEMLAKMN